MGITLDQLIFDPSNPDDGANMGAYVRAGDDGTAIGHVGDALKVDIGSVADLDIRDLSAAQDNVAISDGTDTLAVNADGSINATVTATDLDVRNLTFATDKVDASGSEVSLDAASLAALENITVTVDNASLEISNDAGNPIPVNGTVTVQDGGGSLTVDATDLDIRDLAFATDKVDASGSEVKQDSYDSWKATAQAINTTASELASTPLANRVRMNIQNLGAKEIYIGEANTVTSSTGSKIAAGASADFEFSAGADVWALTPSGTADVRILEFAY